MPCECADCVLSHHIKVAIPSNRIHVKHTKIIMMLAFRLPLLLLRTSIYEHSPKFWGTGEFTVTFIVTRYIHTGSLSVQCTRKRIFTGSLPVGDSPSIPARCSRSRRRGAGPAHRQDVRTRRRPCLDGKAPCGGAPRNRDSRVRTRLPTSRLGVHL